MVFILSYFFRLPRRCAPRNDGGEVGYFRPKTSAIEYSPGALPVSQAAAHFVRPKGEFTIVIEGCKAEALIPQLTDYAREELGRLRLEGVPAKEAVASVARATKLPRNVLYKAWLDMA